jgi:1,4-dihydroxy-2-naphthoyl-CoA hydrolase
MNARKSVKATAQRHALLPPNSLGEVARANCERILRGGMAKALGLRITEIEPGQVVAEMKLLTRHLNHNGRVNGGAIMAFADLLGAMGAGIHRPAGYRGGTLESKTNFFASGTGPAINGTCIPLHIGRTTSVWQTTVRNIDGRTIAIVTQTQMALPEEGRD